MEFVLHTCYVEYLEKLVPDWQNSHERPLHELLPNLEIGPQRSKFTLQLAEVSALQVPF